MDPFPRTERHVACSLNGLVSWKVRRASSRIIGVTDKTRPLITILSPPVYPNFDDGSESKYEIYSSRCTSVSNVGKAKMSELKACGQRSSGQRGLELASNKMWV